MQKCIPGKAENDDKCQEKTLTNVNEGRSKKEAIFSLPGDGNG